MMNRTIAFFAIFWLLSITVCSQVVSGIILDGDGLKPLSYANVSILGTRFGEIADENGKFQFENSSLSDLDSVRISYIGYENVTLSVIDFKNLESRNILLRRRSHFLREVTVIGNRKTLQVGSSNKLRGYTGWGGGVRPSDGLIRGYIVQHDLDSVLVSQVAFKIKESAFDSVRFRLILLNTKDDEPSNNITHENIFVTTTKKNGWVVRDLIKEDLIVSGRIFIGLEWVDAWGNDSNNSKLTIEMSKHPGMCFEKNASSDEWQRFATNRSLAINLDVYTISSK